MKHSLLLLVFSAALLPLGLMSQDETMRVLKTDVSEYRNDTLWTHVEQPTLLLIPFDPKMYKSQIDRSIGNNDGTTYEQIVNNWRVGFDNVMFIELDPKYKVIRLIVEDEHRKADLNAIYGASKLEYRVVPKKEMEEQKKKLKLPKIKQHEEEPKPHGTQIKNGQIVSQNDGQERFMATVVQDSSIFNYMHNKYGSVLYVFINEFDIGPMKGLDYRAFESDEYQREITVHYSIYTHQYEIYSGIATSYFPSTVNSQRDIIIETLPKIAKAIALKIPIILKGENTIK